MVVMTLIMLLASLTTTSAFSTSSLLVAEIRPPGVLVENPPRDPSCLFATTTTSEPETETDLTSARLLEAQKALVALDNQNEKLAKTAESFRSQMIQYQGQLTDSIMKRQQLTHQLTTLNVQYQGVKEENAKLQLELSHTRSMYERKLAKWKRESVSLRILARQFWQILGERIRGRITSVRSKVKSIFSRKKDEKDSSAATDSSAAVLPE